MTPRERVLAVLRGQTPDRVPWMGDLDYWVSSSLARGTLPRRHRGEEGLFRLHRDLNVGFYLQGYFPFRTDVEGVRISEVTEHGRTSTEVATPVGTIRQVSTYLPESYTTAITERFVSRVQDLRVLRYWHEHMHFKPHYEPARERQRLVAENGIVLCYLPKSPLMEMIALVAGVETVVAAWAEARAELEETLAVMGRKAEEAARIALEAPAECLMLPENLASDLVGRRLYDAYVRPYEETWVREIRSAGKHSFIHFDGALRGLLRDVASTGVDVIEAVTPAPLGDLSLEEMRAIAGDRVILWGGLPGACFPDTVSDEEFDRLILGALEVMRRDPRCVLGVADQVPPLTRPERIRRVAELVELHGAY